MLSTLLHTTDLKTEFENPHGVQIVSVTSCDAIYIALLNIWITENYQSIEQVVVYFEGVKIVAIYKDIFEKGTLWKCIYGLENGNYLLGSGYSSLNWGAKLALFKEDKLLTSRTFDKGYSTEITKIESANGDAILINGNWYQCVPAGGHDDFYPERWKTKITKEGQDFLDAENPALKQSYFSASILDSNFGNFYVLESHGISKYSVKGERIWNQGLGHFGLEGLMPLNKIAPYYKTQNGITVTDGVWFSGIDYTYADRAVEDPLFGRVTASGTILSFTQILYDFPEVYKIHAIVSGTDSNCLLIGETLRIGEGTGLFLLHVHFSSGIFSADIQYLNFNIDDLQLSISDIPSFQEYYLDIKGVYPQSFKLEDLNEIIIFGNVNHGHNRDNGMVWSVKIDLGLK
ncbi:hypothetical protein CLU83_1921 [Flavobacterium sp. 1]|uniref:hypothetical protein n=1 Tax=Flavobacterium sp. 1 TaxID=2035200 RepID=UPI000C24F27A|nr:hypothetical protein [Flavobacterium sp. 1]PJJ08635.1 hypothetical protein CLU83_1921 [Flavobacterium sp. 1]